MEWFDVNELIPVNNLELWVTDGYIVIPVCLQEINLSRGKTYFTQVIGYCGQDGDSELNYEDIKKWQPLDKPELPKI